MAPEAIKRLLLLAALAMWLPVPILQYVGEESYYALGAYEIFSDKHWWHQSVYGLPWPKTPLYNWLIIAVAQMIGWQHLEIATRIVSVTATLGSAAIVFLMSRRLFRQAPGYAPWLGALVYLTMGEISFWYGWLGYADATFGFFIFASISSLWVAIEEKRLGWLFVSLILISLAFLTKNISCYAIYLSAAVILVWRHNRWTLTFHPLYLIPLLISLSLPWVYQNLILDNARNTTVAINDALRNFLGYSIWEYFSHWLLFPLLFFGRAFPVTVLLVWFYFKERSPLVFDHQLKTLIFILLLCLFPFWLSAAGTPRYLVPFYGLLALLLTGLTLQLNIRQLRLVTKSIIIVLALKIPYSFIGLPYVKDWRPERDIKAVAEEIMHISNDKIIRTRNDVSTGLSIGCYININTPEGQYIRWYDGKEKGVYIITEVEDSSFGELIKHWRLRGNHTYLYWKP